MTNNGDCFMRTNIKKFNAGLHKAFKSTAAKVGTGMATLGASSMALASGSVASSIGGSAQTELTAAQGIIVGMLTTLVLIAIGFVVYRLIKKAG
jgi:hypothetical protein